MKVHLFFFILCFFTPGFFWGQSKFSITLTVEDNSAFTAYHNEPIIFTTSLVNKTLQQNILWNEDANAWLAQVTADYKAGLLTKEEFEKETALVTKEKRTIKIDSVGTSLSPWFRQLQFRILLNNTIEQRNWPISILGDPETDSTAVLDEKGYYTIKHHISPQQVSKLKAGTYKVQVMLAGVWSNEVTVKIRSANIPNGVLHKRTMLLRLGNYYLQKKDAEKALYYATAILKKNPADISGLVLKGESYILQKQYKLALATFTKASQLYNKNKHVSPTNEPPLYLIATIAWLQKRQ